jgi:hypothetical protein
MEIPVYFSDEFSKYMHIFQFPNKKRNVEGELSRKTLAKSFKIDVNYSANSVTDSEKTSFVSRPLNLSSKYWIGRLKEDGLYLSSLDQISQFYPSLDHLNVIVEQDSAIKVQDDMVLDTEDAKIVQMSMKNEDADAAIKKENIEFLRKLEEEKWNSVEWVFLYTKFRNLWGQMDF